jgi:predicted nuclease of restriction endonuclease-like (RecB) superfamily
MSKDNQPSLSFDQLVSSIVTTDTSLQSYACKAVNQALTLRNWLIGFYIAHFELNGSDRAEYGQNIFGELSDRLKKTQVSNCGKRQLYHYLRLFQLYPQIVRSMPALLNELPLFEEIQKVPPVRALLDKKLEPSVLPPVGAISYRLDIASNLSYTHFRELVQIDDDLKRQFYEIEAMQGVWSVRELKRQISSLYFERTGLSTNKQKLADYVASIAEKRSPILTIRDPLVFEFLGINSQEVMYESDLEKAILANLQEFLLEMGHGFCFEAQQKRILIGDEHFFIDLVFYNRILKCHVLTELKVGAFSHEYLGQLNTYVSWYKANEMREGDNPPIGLLLCTQKNHPQVEYALAGMNNQLFVSKYLIELPSTEAIARFLDEKMRVLGLECQYE